MTPKVHPEECFMTGRCVCHTTPTPEPAFTYEQVATATAGLQYRLQEQTARADSWRNTSIICLIFTAASITVTGLRVLGWI